MGPMGVHDVSHKAEGEEHRAFMHALLADLQALERMHDENLIETGIRRIGAEQELALVDEAWQPALKAVQILEAIDEPRLTTELAQFNLECNLDPLELKGKCFSEMEASLRELLERIGSVAESMGTKLLLTGILPTLDLEHLSLESMTPNPRYHAINDIITGLRGGSYELRIKGADELSLHHDNIMLEALNTSFQLHFQVTGEEFAPLFNIAQAITAPTLAAAVNSPILFGKRLWKETRIAIFQQTVDTRRDHPHGRESVPRVRFGERWADHSVLELFRDDIARFRLIMSTEVQEDPLATLDAGQTPKLRALQMHNSTMYRWNRPCYGVTEGKPHLRIENRVLPSGPTVVDEMANAALWVGLMAGGMDAFGDVRPRMDFEDARANFTAAAREGLASQITWFDGETIPVDRLVLERLLPVAEKGLAQAGVDSGDSQRLLSIIHDRVASRKTGSSWLLQSAALLRGRGTRAQRRASLTAATVRRQETERPVHEWKPADLSESGAGRAMFERVGQYMTTDLYTVGPDELIDLAASIMDWEKVRHVPVEDDENRLVGLVSFRSLLRMVATKRAVDREIAVRELMIPNPLTVSPETTTLDAINLMRANAVSALPVVSDERLVGIVTEHDFMTLAEGLLLNALSDQDEPDSEGNDRL